MRLDLLVLSDYEKECRLTPREEAEELVKASFSILKKVKQEAHKKFVEACRAAHDVGISDRQISDLIDNDYKRPTICQFRNEKEKDE
jgi:hypothetical protein